MAGAALDNSKGQPSASQGLFCSWAAKTITISVVMGRRGRWAGCAGRCLDESLRILRDAGMLHQQPTY